jgi:hypothetical protein
MSVTPRARLSRLVRLGASDEHDTARLAVAGVATVSPLLFAVCIMLGGGEVTWWWLVFAPAGAATVAYAETPAALVMWAMLLVLWVGQVPGPFTWWSLPAAGCVAAGHAALTLVAGHPTAGALPTEAVRRTARRLAVVLSVAGAVALVGQGVRAVGVTGQVSLAVAAVLVVAVWVSWGWRRDA